MFASTTLVLMSALALAARAADLNANQFEERENQIATEAPKIVNDFNQNNEVGFAEACTAFAFDDCNDRNAALAAIINGDDEIDVKTEKVNDLFRALLLEGFQTRHSALAALEDAAEQAKTQEDAEAHADAVNEFAKQLDLAVETLASRTLFDAGLVAEDGTDFNAAMKAGLQQALTDAVARLEKFQDLADLRVELAQLIADAEKAKKDNAKIGETQKTIIQAEKDAKAEIDAIRAALVGQRLQIVTDALVAEQQSAVKFRLDQAAVPAAEGVEEQEEVVAADEAVVDAHLVHAVLADADAARFEEVQTAAEEYPDVVFATVDIEGTVTYELVCTSDHNLDAVPNQSCEEQLSNLAADTETTYQQFNVLNQLDVDVANEEIVNKGDNEWKAPVDKWNPPKKDDGGYGGDHNEKNQESESEEEEDDGAASVFLSIGAVLSAFAMRF